MKPLSLLSAWVLAFGSLAGCAHQTSSFEARKIELLGLDLTKTENSLVICEQFPTGKRYPIPISIAEDFRDVLLRAQPQPTTDTKDFSGTISPPPDLSWIGFGEATWYFEPPAEPHGFALDSDSQTRFARLIRRTLKTASGVTYP